MASVHAEQLKIGWYEKLNQFMGEQSLFTNDLIEVQVIILIKKIQIYLFANKRQY